MKLRNTSRKVASNNYGGTQPFPQTESALRQFRCVEAGGRGGVPWATPRCRSSRSSRRRRIPGAAHILAEQQNPRAIPLLCPLSPITTSDTHKHTQTPRVHSGGWGETGTTSPLVQQRVCWSVVLKKKNHKRTKVCVSVCVSEVRRLELWGRARGRFSGVAAELWSSLRARSPPAPLSVYAERGMPPPSGYGAHAPAHRLRPRSRLKLQSFK